MDSLCCPKGKGLECPESQASLRIDAATAEKGRFRMKTGSALLSNPSRGPDDPGRDAPEKA
jgi:hypothetical protein